VQHNAASPKNGSVTDNAALTIEFLRAIYGIGGAAEKLIESLFWQHPAGRIDYSDRALKLLRYSGLILIDSANTSRRLPTKFPTGLLPLSCVKESPNRLAESK
jgi:hypothetical protein